MNGRCRPDREQYLPTATRISLENPFCKTLALIVKSSRSAVNGQVVRRIAQDEPRKCVDERRVLKTKTHLVLEGASYRCVRVNGYQETLHLSAPCTQGPAAS